MLLIQIGAPEKQDPTKTILYSHIIQVNGESPLTLILPCSRTGTVWFYTSTSNKRAA